MTQGFGLIFLDGGSGGEGAGCRVGAGPWFRCVLFCPYIIIKIKILNSEKTKRTLSLCWMSFWCVPGIFVLTYDDLQQSELVYVVLV